VLDGQVRVDDLRTAADRNVVAALELFGRFGAGADLSRSSGVLRISSATPFVGAFHNAVLRESADVTSDVMVDEARRFATVNRRDVVIWAGKDRDDDLATYASRQGLDTRPAALGMVLRQPPQLPDTAALTWVVDDAGVEAFASVHRAVFKDSGRDVRAVQHFASSTVLLHPDVSAVVATVDGVPASCAMVIRSGRTAGVYWVATDPALRRRGLGAVVTAAVSRAAFEYGVMVVVLQATELGVPVYRKLGFEPFTQYQRFVVPPHH
jgi:GNAT superfamily N-acetyltransferase